jgi:outer membrane protein assembly factor BamE (lipoprotein component of BamABCDE complex)
MKFIAPKLTIATLLTTFLITGCFSMGRKINADAASNIIVGRTTKSQVAALLGSPDGSTSTGQGDTIWNYNYVGSQMKAQSFIPVVGGLLGGANMQTQSTTVIFNSNGVVKDFQNSANSTETGVNLGASKRPTLNELDSNKRPL